MLGLELEPKGHATYLIKRIREHPDMTVADHLALIRDADPWWEKRGYHRPAPRVIYGNGTQFGEVLADWRHSREEGDRENFEDRREELGAMVTSLAGGMRAFPRREAR
jgi:hypothetical protein